MDGVKAIKVADRTAMRLEGRCAHELSEQELKGARSFQDLTLLESNDREQSRAVLARAIYEASYPQKGSRCTVAYLELLTEQLNCTRQLVESLKFLDGHWVYRLDGKFVQLKGTAGRIRRLRKPMRRLWIQRIWLRFRMLLHEEPA